MSFASEQSVAADVLGCTLHRGRPGGTPDMEHTQLVAELDSQVAGAGAAVRNSRQTGPDETEVR